MNFSSLIPNTDGFRLSFDAFPDAKKDDVGKGDEEEGEEEEEEEVVEYAGPVIPEVPDMEHKEAAFKEEQKTNLTLPPPTEDEPVPVEFRITVFRLYDINTPALSANVKLGFIL